MMKKSSAGQWLCAGLLVSALSSAEAGVEYGLQANANQKNTFTLYVRSDQPVNGINAMVSGAQVSLMLPLNSKITASAGASVEGVNSGEYGLWQVNSWNGSSGSGHAGQTDHSQQRILSVGQVAAGARIEFAEAGEPLAMFEFVLKGCQPGALLRIVNNQNDPDGAADAITRLPNSIGSNAANSWTSIEGELYENNFSAQSEAVSCQ